MSTTKPMRCDVCGKWISYGDIANGSAQRWLITPDSHYTKETYGTLCKKHAVRNAK